MGSSGEVRVISGGKVETLRRAKCREVRRGKVWRSENSGSMKN